MAGMVTRVDDLKGDGDKAYLRFSILNKRQKKIENEWKDDASFFNFVIFGKRATALVKYLTKGSLVAVDGRLQQEKFTNKENKTVSQVGFVVSNVQLLGKFEKKDQTSAPSNTPSNANEMYDPNEIPDF